MTCLNFFTLRQLHQRSLFEVLGHGKESTVYKGRKKQTICYYAIKRVPKDAKGRVLQEVRFCFWPEHCA